MESPPTITPTLLLITLFTLLSSTSFKVDISELPLVDRKIAKSLSVQLALLLLLLVLVETLWDVKVVVEG